MCVETLTGVLFWFSDLLGKPFRAACFPFETLSGSLFLLLLQIPQVAFGEGTRNVLLEYFLGAKVIGYVFSNSELERIFSNSNFFYYLVISFYFFQLFEILFLKIISKIFVAKSQEI